MKKIYLFVLVVLLLVGVFFGIKYYFLKKPREELEGQCKIKEMIFYYHPKCRWCQKVKNEATISKFEELGVDVTQIDVTVGPSEHEFSGVPTFVINDKIYTGYRTFEQLTEILNCQYHSITR